MSADSIIPPQQSLGEGPQRKKDNTSVVIYYCVLDWIFIVSLIFVASVVPKLTFDVAPSLTSRENGHTYNLTFHSTVNATQTQEFSIYLGDPIFSRTYSVESAVSGEELALYSVLVPFVYCLFFIVVILMFGLQWHTYLIYQEIISVMYCFALGNALIQYTTKIAKLFVSWPRPDSWDRAGIYHYNNTQYELDQDDYYKAWKSFPSGHTSYMFLSAFLVFWWTKSKLYHSDFLKLRHFKFCNGKINVDFWLCMQFANCWTFLGGCFVSVSRIDDRRHFPTDVFAGFLLGMANALFSYQCFFSFKDPFSIRVNRMLKSGEIKHKRDVHLQ